MDPSISSSSHLLGPMEEAPISPVTRVQLSSFVSYSSERSTLSALLEYLRVTGTHALYTQSVCSI